MHTLRMVLKEAVSPAISTSFIYPSRVQEEPLLTFTDVGLAVLIYIKTSKMTGETKVGVYTCFDKSCAFGDRTWYEYGSLPA